MEEGGSAHTSLLVKDDTSSHGEDSQSLLEQHQGPQLKSRGPDWRAPVIILVLECLESMAFNGIGTNLVVYIRSVLHGGIASSASTVSLWYGTSFFVPILGATIADTYLGNYKTVLISLIMYLLGMILITVATFMTYTPAMCSDSTCLSSNGVQTILFFAALYLTAVGCGGVIVASFRNMGLEVPEDGSLLYEVKSYDTQRRQKLAHSDDFRLLDKAAIISDQSLANGSCQELTQLQRIGIGRFLMIFAMAIAAFLEMKRLESVQAPDSMKSMLTAFALLTTALVTVAAC
ncbi:hypothetical protein QOZ80_7BG0607560 [Eleusine coracana subsp. coracana]|nr:hypothetical protein QOZ80_7BG0607560 [Eleusine coracana subsp. coracana]